jgi:hypothetical protein
MDLMRKWTDQEETRRKKALESRSPLVREPRKWRLLKCEEEGGRKAERGTCGFKRTLSGFVQLFLGRDFGG